jgi:HEAT repeat protein
MAQVFISYYHQDRQSALSVKEKIEQIEDVTAWMDEDIGGGEAWRPAIDQAIWDSFALVLVVTPDSLERPWVTYEWIFALGANKLVIPAIFEPPGNTEFHERLKELQWRFFTDDREPQWNLLIGDLEMRLRMTSTIIYPPPGANTIVKNAVDDLNSSDPARWYRAIEVLENLSEDDHASEVLRLTANDHSVAKVRHRAAFAHLRQTQYGGVVIKTFREAALEGEREDRILAWDLLGNLGGDDAIDILAKAFHQETDTMNRRRIIQALGRTGQTGYPGAVPVLSRILREEKNGTLQDETVNALASIKMDVSAEALEEAYPNSGIGKRKQIARGLGIIGNSKAVKALLDLLRTEEDTDVQREILGSLRDLKDKERLQEALQGLEVFLTQKRDYQLKQTFSFAIRDIRQRLSDK